MEHKINVDIQGPAADLKLYGDVGEEERRKLLEQHLRLCELAWNLFSAATDSWGDLHDYVYAEPEEGDWIMEVSSFHYPQAHFYRLGKLVQREEDEYLIELPDGQQMHWTNAMFYRIPLEDKV